MQDTKHAFLWSYDMKKIQYGDIGQIKIASFAWIPKHQVYKMNNFLWHRWH